jgi:hypothetical protein
VKTAPTIRSWATWPAATATPRWQSSATTRPPAYPVVTPNAHALVQRFPLLDNFYDPSRQSADGHNWIVQAMAPYSDDIQSPDWLRDYPSNGGDALAYQKAKAILWDGGKAPASFKNYGEYIEYNTFNCMPPTGRPPNLRAELDRLLQRHRDYENGANRSSTTTTRSASHSPLPNLINNTVQNYPQFDSGHSRPVPRRYLESGLRKDVAAGTVPQLEIMWISSDHTGGPPTAKAMQADNDLAVGRFVDIISHSSIWSSSAIFVEEDDAQTGVDHVDGHRSPGYVISPYVKQSEERWHRGGVYVGQHLLHAGQHDPHHRADSRHQADEPVRPGGLADERRSSSTTRPADNFLPWTHVPAPTAEHGVTPRLRLRPSRPRVLRTASRSVQGSVHLEREPCG